MERRETEKALLEKRANLWEKQKKLHDLAKIDGRDSLNLEEQGEYDAIEKDFDGLTKKLEHHRKELEMEGVKIEADQKLKDVGQLNETADERKEQYSKAFTKFVRGGTTSLNQDERKHLTSNYVRGTGNQTTTDAEGGFMVPEGWTAEINVGRQAVGSVRQAARILRTSTGNTIPYPQVDDTATSVLLTAEAAATTVQDLTFTSVNLLSFTFRTLVKVSIELLQDEDVNFQTLLTQLFGERMLRGENAFFTTGTGSAQPEGVVTAATEGPPNGLATADTLVQNDIYELQHTVDPAYRIGNQSGFMMHDSILKEVKQLSVGSADDRPLWQPGLAFGEPDSIAGRPFWINQNMASDITVAGAKIMLYGDFSNFIIRDSLGFTMTRLNERFIDNGLIGFIAFGRTDSRYVGTASGLKYLYNPAT